MLASTVQFSSYGRPHHHKPPTQGDPSSGPHEEAGHSPLPQDPTACHDPTPHPGTDPFPPPGTPTTKAPHGVLRPTPTSGQSQQSTFHPRAPPPAHSARTVGLTTPHPTQGGPGREMLLRKEVIQPHLPVR